MNYEKEIKELKERIKHLEDMITLPKGKKIAASDKCNLLLSIDAVNKLPGIES